MAADQPRHCGSFQCLVGLTWLMLALCDVQHCHSFTIDQIISSAMKDLPADEGGVVYDRDQGTVRVDLDMVYTVQDWARLLHMNSSGAHHVHKRQAIRESAWSRYWPNGIIYYEIDHSDFTRRDVRVLYAAMEEWMRHTCVQFRPATHNSWNKIVFKDGNGCASSVGMIRKPQKVTLSKACRIKGVVIHELGHVLGFNHEQTRPDRDEHVTVHWENIPTRFEFNFRKYTWAAVRDLGVPYDYLSIMHYGKDTFTKNGGVTLKTRDPRYQYLIGNRRGLSFRDIKSANILYNCRPSSDRCALRDEDCPGEGFVSKDCSCWCPTKDIYTHPITPYYPCDPLTHSQEVTASRSASSIDTSPECEDENEHCQMWERRGECQNHPAYMHVSCRKACGLCDSEEPPCRDEYSRCAYWRQKGYCGSYPQSSIGSFLATNCKLTCGICTSAPGPKVGRPLPCEVQCQDEHEKCQEWAQRGECSATPDYMLQHCKKSCDVCCT